MRGRAIGAVLLLAVAFPAAAGTVVRDCRQCPEMVEIPPGRLPDGTEPVRPLLVSRTEVTFAEWDACVAAGACRGGKDDHHWGRGRRPVINVSWDDAVAYAHWLSTLTGHDYRLPSGAEWEYAARGGTSTAYWWGDAIGSGHANCRDCGSRWGGRSTAPVGSFPPNPYGLYDMNGNVWQWTTDCWQAAETAACPDRTIRGGSWYYFAPMSTVTARARFRAEEWSYNIGIRVVRYK
jgi:formylglycine-generating enzyme required for sulfatase activity